MALKKDFGSFELHEKIGSGGMASVYLGKQKSLDRPVVLKILYPHLAEDEKLVTRFEREARAAAHLRHENVVQVIDCGRFDDLSYIAMEFVEGLNLKQWIETYGSPPIEMGLLMLRDICRGIEHAHQHRVVHRDIKPANIMLTPDGTIKIMDFGLARRGEDTTAVTVVGAVLGTPAYMSPEQASGEAVDERSDVFSAGVVGYELLGGKRPFPGDSYSSVLRSILTVEPPPLESFNPLVPEDVVGIIHRMLQKDVSKRFQGMSQVRGDLETVVEQMGLHRGKDLLREYAQDPARVGQILRKKRLSRHLDQGLYYENMGLSKIDDALLEFRRVLHLEPDNKIAAEHLKKLERDRELMLAERGTDATDKTLVLEPQGADATMVLPAGAAATAGAAPPAGPRLGGMAARSRPMPKPPASAATTRNLLMGAASVLALLVVVFVVLWARSGSDGSAPKKSEPQAAETQVGEVPKHETPPVTPKENLPAPPASPGHPASTTASLILSSDPALAKVILDGVTQSKRSNATFKELAPGPHTVRVEKNGYTAQEKQVTLEAGSESRLSFVLPPAPGANGTLEIRVTPYATFFVDGRQVDANKVSTRINLKPGRYNVRAVHPAFSPKTWTGVTIEPNAVKRLSFDFVPSAEARNGSLRITSGGAWAYVYLDGQNTGKTTPCILTDLATGSHAVSLFREGFVMQGGAKSVTVKSGEVVEVSFVLRPR